MSITADASLTLHNGTAPITGHAVITPNEGETPEAARARAVAAARADLEHQLADPQLDGRDMIDAGAQIHVVVHDEYSPQHDFVRDLPSGNLVTNNIVRLFGAPMVSHSGTGADTARLWVPIQNVVGDKGTIYTVWREDTYEGENGHSEGGRLVRVPQSGRGRQIMVHGEWRNLSDYDSDHLPPGGRVPSGLVPKEDYQLVSDPGDGGRSVPLGWTMAPYPSDVPSGYSSGYIAYTDGSRTVRFPLDSTPPQIRTGNGPWRMAGAADHLPTFPPIPYGPWQYADSPAATGPLAVNIEGRTERFTLTAGSQTLDHGMLFDCYESTRTSGGSTVTVHFRRPHEGGANAPWFMQGPGPNGQWATVEGQMVAAPAAPPRMQPTVTQGGSSSSGGPSDYVF
jgi:hypothetical protein